MKSTTLLAGLGFFHLTTAFPQYYPRSVNETGTTAPGCATGVHFIVARGSRETPGPGIMGTIATTVMKSVPGSDLESVDYPATLDNYTGSEGLGVAGMTKLIQNYATRCPTSKIALLGYSQGAQVIGDTLGGTTEGGQPTTPPIPADSTKNLVAVIQAGDPSHIPNQPQNAGNSTQPGIFQRSNPGALLPYASKIQSYCDTGDVFCDGGPSLEVHRSYVKKYGDVAAAFVVGKVMNGTSVKGMRREVRGERYRYRARYIGRAV